MAIILFLHGLHSLPGGVKPTFLIDHGHTVINPALDDDDFDAAVATAQAEFDEHQPDVIVGSSRGGAVAMNLNAGNTPLVLLCPAWKGHGAARTLKAEAVILHSRADDVVPFADSEELAKNSGATLIETGNDHRLADAKSLEIMLKMVRSFTIPASFSTKCPYAYHVVPLHAFKLIALSRQLLSKSDLLNTGVGLRRSSTADVDTALGLAKFIHFYLPKSKQLDLFELPIVATQLRASAKPPFPHVVIAISTSELADSQCGVCNFNVAVSRPAYGTIKGGNHARGTSPRKVVEHWHGFRNDAPTPERLRYSHWHEGIEVPLLLGQQITHVQSHVGYRATIAELLLQSPFTVPQSAIVFAFSDADLASLRLLKHDFPIQLATSDQLAWYRDQDRVETQVRETINDYFRDEGGELPSLDYDRLRPS